MEKPLLILISQDGIFQVPQEFWQLAMIDVQSFLFLYQVLFTMK